MGSIDDRSALMLVSVGIPIGGAPESSCSAVFTFRRQSQYVATAFAFTISMSIINGDSHGTQTH
jgi:hypothetical protein